MKDQSRENDQCRNPLLARNTLVAHDQAHYHVLQVASYRDILRRMRIDHPLLLELVLHLEMPLIPPLLLELLLELPRAHPLELLLV